MSFTKHHLFFDDVEVGNEWESLGRTITEADVVNFAGLSGDFNPMHVDHEYARSTPFARPIAHGMLVLAIGTGLAIQAPPMRTMAFLAILDWQMKNPVFFGDTIRVKAKVLAKEEGARGRRGTITWSRQILNQTGQIVQEGQTRTLVEGRANIRPQS